MNWIHGVIFLIVWMLFVAYGLDDVRNRVAKIEQSEVCSDKRQK